jgi:hypothetical protein
MSKSYFCYGYLNKHICGTSNPKHFHPEKYTKCKKCTQKLELDDLVPLVFFEELASDFMAEWQCNKKEATSMYKKVLKEYPFCLDGSILTFKFDHLRKAATKKSFSYDGKIKLIAYILLELAFEHITTINLDIGNAVNAKYESTKEEYEEYMKEEYESYSEAYNYGIKEKHRPAFQRT